jgi:hypothetical protein
MGFKQPSLKEHPEANVLAGMPTLVTVVDVDLIDPLTISNE